MISKNKTLDSEYRVFTFTSNMQYLRTLQEVADGEEVDFAYYLEHVGPRQFKCTICEKTIQGKKSDGMRHVEAIHYPGTFQYECEYCRKKLNSKSQLANHKYKFCIKRIQSKGQ